MADRTIFDRFTDALSSFRDPLPSKILGDIETKSDRPNFGQTGWYSNLDTFQYGWRSEQVNYAREIGRLDNVSLVMAVVNWTGINLAEALPVVQKLEKDGTLSADPNHEAALLIRRPNPYHIWADYCLAGAFSWWMGNWYMMKVRDASGSVVELWYLPHFLVEPRWPYDGKSPEVPLSEVEGDPGQAFISHYQYNQPGKSPILIPKSEMVHIKRGVNLDNPRKGVGVWDGVLQELYGHNAVNKFSAAILGNMGMTQVILSPKDKDVVVQPEQARHIKEQWIINTTGQNANKPMVNPVAIEATKLGFSPQELDLKELDKAPQAAIAGVTGIPAIVLQFPIGLEHGHYGAAYEQARQQGYECLPPDARVWTDVGPIPISEIESGDSVWSFSDGRLVLRLVVAKGSAGFKELYHVRTTNRLLRASGDHKVLVRESGNQHGKQVSVAWKRVAELTCDDMLVEPKALPDQQRQEDWQGNTVSADLMQFLGAYIGDGYIGANGTQVSVSMPPTDRVCEYYKALALRLFQKEAKRGVSRNKCVDGLTEQALGLIAAGTTQRKTAAFLNLSHGALQSRLRHHARNLPDVCMEQIHVYTHGNSFSFGSKSTVARLLAMGFTGKAKTKRVPSWVFGLSRDLRLAFLAGIVDSDGTIGTDCQLRVSFANRLLMLDVRDLLISVGLQCGAGFSTTQSNAHFGAASKSLETTRWTLNCASRGVSEIPFADPLYRERLVRDSRKQCLPNGGDAVKAGLSSDLGFYKITSIARQDMVEMFDIQVADSQSFIADGVVVHNSVIIPIQNHISEDLTWQVLPEIDDTKGARLTFDITKVRVLQEDRDLLYKRESEALRSGAITINQFLTSVGKDTIPEGEVYLIPAMSTPMTIERIKAIADGTQAPPVPSPDATTSAKFADVDRYIQNLEDQMREFTK